MPNLNVIKWLDQQNSNQLFITTITLAEIAYGLNALPDSQRRKQLEEAFDQVITQAFTHRILAFDINAAHIYGEIMAKRKTLGRLLCVPDGQIAAITYTKGYILATRNSRDFVHYGIEILNPFD